MSEEQKGLDDPNQSDEFLPEDLDSDWGEAWESAFEAEDDEFASEPDEQDEFFIDEDEGAAGTPDSSKTPAESSAPSATSPESLPESFASGKAIAFAATLLHLWRRIPDFLSKLATLFSAIYKRYDALQSSQKIMFGGGIAVIVCLLAVGSFLFGPDEPLPESPGDLKKVVSPHPSSEKVQVAVVAPQEEVTAMLPEKVRKKWLFPEFFIPVASQTGDKSVNFVIIDITLIALLEKDQELPSEKKAFVRDIIYQFYINRPLFELRRYSLARGDMNRELRAWLQKQWPDGPIETIIFNRYHLT